MNGILANIGSSITGNITKAILFIRDMDTAREQTAEESSLKAEELQKKLLSGTDSVLNGLSNANNKASQSFSSLSKGNPGSGFLALEVQFNPATLHLESVAGMEVEYGGGNLGSRSANQLVQIYHPASTTMSMELVFDDVNPADAFMLENIAPSVGNLTSTAASGIKKAMGRDYTVQPQIDGLMSLLTRDSTRQVIFFWGKMCFPGELVSVNSRYTMFSKSGRPIRGVVQLSIRQEEGSKYTRNQKYWEEAFSKVFGKSGMNHAGGNKSTFSKVTNNNILNLNL